MQYPEVAAWPEGKPREIQAPEQTLIRNLLDSAERLPDKPAVVFFDHALSYRSLADQVAQMAAYLQHDCQVEAGDRVAIYSQNCPQYIIAYYAILMAGAVVVPVNPMNLTEELAYILDNAGARTLFVAGELEDYAQPLLANGTLSTAVTIRYEDYRSEKMDSSAAGPFVPWAVALNTRAPLTQPVGEDIHALAVLPYTSGSTGRGKGCVHTHATTQHAISCIHNWFDITTDDVVLSVAPMFHVVGMQAAVNNAIKLACTLVLVPRWDRDQVRQWIKRYEISVWPAIPTMVIDLLNDPDLQADDIHTIRVLFGGGISMPEAVAEKLQAYCGVTFLEGYGMTETMAPATANAPSSARPQCGGLPVFSTDIRLLLDDGSTSTAPDKTGEIIISGPQVMLGYWQNDEANADAFIEIDGKRFLRSGDIGRFSELGHVYIVDRLKRMINASGYKVWPTEVESILYRHPAIAEACVIAGSDAKRGETVKAIIVLKDPTAAVSAEDISDWSREHMAAYKIPRQIEFVAALPKSGTGKVQWKQLQDAENAG